MKLIFGIVILSGIVVGIIIGIGILQPSPEVRNFIVITVSIIISFLILAYYEKRHEQIESPSGEIK
ncbi:MAG TPA: hypothetical protein VMV49_11140 [Candidatus Deferrimicrobium sp.]|nr:hypothetical protein [Candidatus Deferrimicrobium sp.]